MVRGGHMTHGINTDDARQSLHKSWGQVPGNLKRHPDVVLWYANQLIDNDLHDEAEDVVRRTLEKHWHRQLVHLYGLIAGPEPQRQLLAAEGWLKKRPGDALLLLTLGRLSLRNELWGRARDYFQNKIGRASCREKMK